jgi:hypothetical protein
VRDSASPPDVALAAASALAQGENDESGVEINGDALGQVEAAKGVGPWTAAQDPWDGRLSDGSAVSAKQVAIPIESRLSATGRRPRFVVRDRNAAVFFVESGFAIALRGVDRGGWGLHVSLPGARAVAPRPEGELPGRVNSYVGPPAKWKTNLPTYARLVYDGVWPGVAFVVEPRRHGLAYRFEVAPGADASAIRLRWRGALAVRAAEDGGALEIETGAGVLRENGLRCLEGGKEIGCRYAAPARFRDPAGGEWDVGFALGARDHRRAFVIDPVIAWSSYLGGTGTGEDTGLGIAVDAAGNAYLTGYTYSPDFPSAGGFDTTLGGTTDAFVTKVTASGTLAWSSFLGGGGDDYGRGIAVDAAGNAYVTGQTSSTDFPSAGGFDTTRGGDSDAFVTKVSVSGTLAWSSYLGGSLNDYGYGIAVDAAGNAYVTGATKSSDFPSAGGFDTSLGGPWDAFVTKVNAAGASLAWSSFLGGSNDDEGYHIALDTGGNAYVTGTTYSSDFPSGGGFHTTYRGGFSDAFVTKVKAAGASLAWSSYLGGTGNEYGIGVAVDADGNAYVTGSTTSADFPSTGGFDTTFGGGGYDDAFVTKVNAAGSSLAWSSFIGGAGSDFGRAIAIDGVGNAYMTGTTYSSDFPSTGGFDTTLGGTYDAFVTKVNLNGTLAWSSYLGGRAAT